MLTQNDLLNIRKLMRLELADFEEHLKEKYFNPIHSILLRLADDILQIRKELDTEHEIRRMRIEQNTNSIQQIKSI